MSDSATLDAFSAIVGADAVVARGEELEAASVATYGTDQRVVAIVRPRDTRQVAACLAQATALRVPVHVASGGKSWGYGSRVPVASSSILLDLGRMNRIVGFDEELAYVTVEPGVTFAQLHRFLEERGSALMCSVPGTSPDASVLGNAIERGLGVGPMADRFASTCDLEVVLPTGAVIDTGFGRFEGSRSASIHRWGVGPSFDGLFSQSNLGVVTRMTVWLMPKPRELVLATFAVPDHASFERVVPELRALHGDTIDFRLQNAHRLAAQAGPSGPMSRLVRRLTVGNQIAWYGIAAAYARDADESAHHARTLRRKLGPHVSRLTVWTPHAQRAVRSARGILEACGLDVSFVAEATRSLWAGVPTERSLDACYAAAGRPRSGPRADLDADGCGIIHFCPVVPLAAGPLQEVASAVEEVAAAHGFEATINLRVVSRRAVDMVCAIHYDRRDAAVDARARACDAAWWTRVGALGFHPYRAGIHAMDRLPPSRGETDDLLLRMKALVDPAGILAIGRYQPSAADRGEAGGGH